MTAVLEHIRALEAYVGREGACIERTGLPECINGRVYRDVIKLRAGLLPEQELSTLVHELAHWLAHRDAKTEAVRYGPFGTVFEYEAEAVEALVMTRLGLPQPERDPIGSWHDCPTDGLLPASVARVTWASGRICIALGLEP